MSLYPGKSATQTVMLIRERKALNRSGTATQEKGITRLISILDAAREVFMEAGYGGFTMRRIAARAGITIGNLNYYYRTKEDLLQDLLEYVINDYLVEFERRRLIAGHSPEKQLLAVLKFWIDDLGTQETTIFFPWFPEGFAVLDFELEKILARNWETKQKEQKEQKVPRNHPL